MKMMFRKPKLFFNFVLFYLCAVSLFSFSSCQKDKPSITHISSEQIKQIGEEAEFNCTLNNPNSYTVLWIKHDKNQKITLTQNAEPLIKGDNKFDVRYFSNNQTYQLKIKNLKETDTGVYECQILVDVEHQISQETSLQIRRAPTISTNVTKKIDVSEGESFQLYCAADGFPIPRISWKRENDDPFSSGEIVFNSHIFTVENSTTFDRGTYICVAENGVGKQDQAKAVVYIKSIPKVTADRPKVGQSEGFSAELVCNVDAYPPPIVFWYKNGTEVGKNDFTGNQNNSHEYKAKYTVSSSNKETYGTYMCKAMNKLGSSNTMIELYDSN